MKTDAKALLTQIGIQAACLLIIGVLVFGKNIFVPSITSFSYTIYGLAAILFYNYCLRNNTRNYILLCLIYSILMIIIFQKSTHILRLVRNLCWYLFIALLSYYLTIIEQKEWYLRSKAWIVSSRLFGFIGLYLIMIILNIFVFGFYPLYDHITFWVYLKQAVKIGGTLGIGIGAGIFIGDWFFRERKENQ
jgi:hypothetical protein